MPTTHAHGPLFGKSEVPAVDSTKVWQVTAQQGQTGEEINLSYTSLKVVGSGSFGVVCSARATGGLKIKDEVIAIKKVALDPRYKNRELQIMRAMSHPNIVQLRAFFYSSGDKKDDVNLNLILEFLPMTLHRALSRYKSQLKSQMPSQEIKLYAYQLFRGLGYLHTVGLCHRDIKPPNILCDPSTGLLKIIDFGSAKQLVPTEPNVAYICSRYYRAPELIFGATSYTTQIDIWSAALCVAEIFLGQPMFAGDSSLDQLVETIRVLGTPSKEQVLDMNPKYKDHKFPSIKPTSFKNFFRPRTDPLALDLLEKTIVYSPKKRLDAYQVMAHPFFDSLRTEGAKLPNGAPLPALFDFTREELSAAPPDSLAKMVPQWTKPELVSRGIDLSNFVPISRQDLRFVFA